MRALPNLGVALLLALPLCAQEEPGTKEIDQALRKAQEELGRVEERARQEAGTRSRERQDLVQRLLELEREERRLARRIEAARQTREETMGRAEAMADRATRLTAALQRLDETIRRGAREVLERTTGSLAGLGDGPFLGARRRLEGLLGPGATGARKDLLRAAGETALAELEAGREARIVTAELPGPEGELVQARLVRVGLLGAAGPRGILVPAGATGFRLVRPGGLFSGRRLRAHLDRLAQVPGGAGPAAVPLDVTGGLAGAALTAEKSLGETLAGGGLVMIPIGLVALLGLAIALGRGIMLAREARLLRRLTRRLPALAEAGRYGDAVRLCRETGGAVGRALAACLEGARLAPERAERVLDQALSKGSLGLQRFLATLGVLGTLAPFLGLLGTVTGMIRTFSVLTLAESTDSSLLAGGIAEALITTECGLVTAIPLVLLHSFLAGRSDRIEADLEETATAILLHREEGKGA